MCSVTGREEVAGPWVDGMFVHTHTHREREQHYGVTVKTFGTEKKMWEELNKKSSDPVSHLTLKQNLFWGHRCGMEW